MRRLATSTDIERLFSGGRLTVSRMRHSLSSDSKRASIVLGTWMKADGLLSNQDLSKKLKEKRNANKNGSKTTQNVDNADIIVLE